jgi:predicted CXXCH cytochrome family protein
MHTQVASVRRSSIGVIALGAILVLAMPTLAFAAHRTTFSSVLPRSGSVSTVALPSVSVTVYDSNGVKGAGTYALYIDGVKVKPRLAYVKGWGYRKFKLTYTVRTSLAASVHSAKVTVHDRKHKNSTYTWRFTVLPTAPPKPVVPDMPMPAALENCVGCHTGYPAAHPMNDCGGCHGPIDDSVYGPGDESAHTLSCALEVRCHGGGGAFPHVLGSDCASCHQRSYAGIPQWHSAPLASYHASTNAFCSSEGCHLASLTKEHYRRPVGGAAFSCGTCHRSADPAVVAAIASGSTTCESCHDLIATTHVATAAVHATPVVSCTVAGCHGASAVAVHFGACAPCHGAGKTPSTDCATCHAGVRSTRHEADAAAHRASSPCAIADCHSASVVTIHAAGPQCTACHTPGKNGIAGPTLALAVASGRDQCLSCHSSGQHGAQHENSLVSGVGDADFCFRCHETSFTTDHLKHGTTTCATCHASSRPEVRLAIANADTNCESCHPTNRHHDLHSPEGNPTCVKSGCHDNSGHSFTSLHGGEGSCVKCHDSSDPLVVSAIAQKRIACTDCHAERIHVAAHASIAAGDCGACHTKTIEAIHVATGDCGTCHGNDWDDWSWRVMYGPDGPVTSCVSCHTQVNHEEKHIPFLVPGDGDSDFCVRCHDTGFLPDHAGRGVTCAQCHSSTRPEVVDAIAARDSNCESCHPTNRHDDHHPMAGNTGCVSSSCHFESGQSDFAGLHGGPSGCVRCHDSKDPVVVSAIAEGRSRCLDCHTGSPHVSIHDDPANSGACATCHTAPTSHPVADCGSCHVYPARFVETPHPTGAADCASCHASIATAHTSITNSTCFGIGCHDSSKNLVTIHAPYTGTGSENPQYGSPCALCHENPAIDTKTSGTSCTRSCHTIGTHSRMNPQHTPQPTSETGKTCIAANCHGKDLNAIHGAYADLTKCALCHGVAGNWSKKGDCLGCHTSSHADTQAAHAAAASPNCLKCHQADVLSTHAVSDHGECSVCHDNPALPGGVLDRTVECVSCHAYTLATGLDHANFTAIHAPTADSAECWTNCHGTHSRVASVTDTRVHRLTLSEQPNCPTCHNGSFDLTGKTSSCLSCHGDAPGQVPTHVDYAARHVASTPASLECVGCHETADAAVLHEASPLGCNLCHVTAGRGGAAQCGFCHAPHNPARNVPLKNYAIAECTSPYCHGTYATKLVASPTAHYAAHSATHQATAAPAKCAACHSMDLLTAHASVPDACVTCHETRVDGFTSAWDGSCSACHAADPHAAVHTSAAPADCTECHPAPATHPQGLACPDCHAYPTAFAAATHPVSTSACLDCHSTPQGHPTGIGCPGCHATGTAPWSQATHPDAARAPCTDCHTAPAVHYSASGTGCAACHNPEVPFKATVLP